MTPSTESLPAMNADVRSALGLCGGRMATLNGHATLQGRARPSMNDLLAARSQMGMSLAFHIIFAVIGMAMPVLMVLAEWRYRRSGDPLYLDLAKRWAKG